MFVNFESLRNIKFLIYNFIGESNGTCLVQYFPNYSKQIVSVESYFEFHQYFTKSFNNFEIFDLEVLEERNLKL